MRQTIQRWHVGQLLMAWLGGTIVVGLLGSAGLVAYKVRAERENANEYRGAALRRLATDSTVRADSAHAQALIDTIKALAKTDSDSAMGLKASWGLLTKTERTKDREILTAWPPTSTAPITALLVLLGGLVLLLPLFLWWATWVWFAGRAARTPPPRTG